MSVINFSNYLLKSNTCNAKNNEEKKQKTNILKKTKQFLDLNLFNEYKFNIFKVFKWKRSNV